MINRLKADRIELIPLSASQLRLWLNDLRALESQLNCNYKGEPVIGPFASFIENIASKVENDYTNYLYHTLWFIVCRANRTIMGEIAFYGVPNENHEVEIGYGLNPIFQGKGYMTEAVKTLCKVIIDIKLLASIYLRIASIKTSAQSSGIPWF